MTAEEITAHWGERCPDYEATCPCCQMWKMFDQVEELTYKVDGLLSDLDSAVEVAFKRGATDWTRLNYPQMFARLSTP